MDIANVYSLIDEHQRIEEAIRLELIDIFDEMPENEEVQKISAGPYVFTIPAQTLSRYDIWGPEFYDFPRQWQVMQNILRSKDSLGEQLKKLRNIAETRKLQISENGQKRTMLIHPSVAARLNTILKGENNAEVYSGRP